MSKGSVWGTLFILVTSAALLYQWHQSSKERAQAAVDDRISQRTAEIQSGTYQDTYGDEGCTSDCSGHEAGFEWAREQGITSEDDCSSHGDSEGSFAQGCRAYVQAEEHAEDEVQEGEEDDE